MLGIVIGSCVLAVILLVTDQREATKSVTSIPRESSGHGSITKELQLIVNGIRSERQGEDYGSGKELFR